MKETGYTEALRGRWRRDLERRALKIRSIPLAKLLNDLADPEKAQKHRRICVELARRSLHCGMTVMLKSGKPVRIYEIRDDGYFYLRRGALPLFADVIDWQRLFSAEHAAEPNPPTEAVKPDQEELRRRVRKASEEQRRKQHEKYRRWKERHDPEELHRYWREAVRRWRAKKKSATSADK